MEKKLDVISVNKQTEKQPYEISLERKRRQRQRARQLAIKRRRRKRLVSVGILAISIIGIFALVKNFDADRNMKDFFKGLVQQDKTDAQKQAAFSDGGFLYEVKFEEFFEENTPQVLSDTEVYERLRELAEQYSELEEIYEKCEEYPVKLLASLCNNPELYEYVEGYLAYETEDDYAALEPKLTAKEKEQKYPLFLQWDRRWGYEEYGDFNIALSGCGPTTLAMAATALTGQDTVTPDKVAAYSMENGHYVEGIGTAWTLMTEGCEEFGIAAEELSLDEQVMKNQLDAGKVIICSMSPGDFTSVGHFIMIYGYEEEGFLVNDANCIYRSNRHWKYEELKPQIRILWAFGQL